MRAWSPIVEEDAQTEQTVERMANALDDRQAAEKQGGVEADHEDRAREAELLGDDREDEVGRVFREVSELLYSVAEPAPASPPPDTAAID